MSTIEDRIKHAAAEADSASDWALSEIGDCDGERDLAVDVLCEALAKLLAAVHQLDNRHRYSDGRAIVSRVEIVDGLVAQHIWKPDGEEPTKWRSDLPSFDPDVPSPGKYEVTTDPATQGIHVRILGGAA